MQESQAETSAQTWYELVFGWFQETLIFFSFSYFFKQFSYQHYIQRQQKFETNLIQRGAEIITRYSEQTKRKQKVFNLNKNGQKWIKGCLLEMETVWNDSITRLGIWNGRWVGYEILIPRKLLTCPIDPHRIYFASIWFKGG